MINPVIPVGAVPSFGKIEEPHKDFYTERQRKLANYVKDVVNLTNPEDKKGRSYADFLKEEHDLDLYIKARRDTNSIVLYSKNKDDELDIIKNYKKGFKPKEADFVSYIEFLKEEINAFRDKLAVFAVTALMFMGVAYLGNKGNSIQSIDRLAKKEFVQKAKDSINVSPNILFKRLAK